MSVTTQEPEYSDLPEETFDEFQMKHQWDMLTEENEALLREVFPNLPPEAPETHQ
jgi:hypothetical protein